MTLRRARGAALGGWPVFLFFVPVVNYALMLFLATFPSRVSARGAPDEYGVEAPDPEPSVELRSALVAVGLTALGGLVLAWLSTYWLHAYGATLFLGLPFAMGVTAGWVYNRPGDQGGKATLSVVTVALGLAALLLLSFAMEGVVCIAMAVPIAWPCALFGGLVGRALVLSRPRGSVLAPALLLVPGFWLERQLARPLERAVTTVREVAARPERVWPHVIGFAELPEPEHWLFATGIAYPVRATLAGTGVGALRRCEFSTGAFVEPITAWEPPAHLAFDVAASPLPMQEWSFYARLRPPHLAHSFRSLRGEFRLEQLPGGRTRLAGTTWYRLELFPLGYWSFFADAIVHRIHARVLAHVAALAEAEPPGSGSGR